MENSEAKARSQVMKNSDFVYTRSIEGKERRIPADKNCSYGVFHNMKIHVVQWGTFRGINRVKFFQEALEITEEPGIDPPVVETWASLAKFFYGVREINIPSLPLWDVGNVTNMNSMFYQAESFNKDIGSWNTGKVANMAGMFADACSFNQDIGRWDTGNVWDMRYMFHGAVAFNQDLSRWDMNKAEEITWMFQGTGMKEENKPKGAK